MTSKIQPDGTDEAYDFVNNNVRLVSTLLLEIIKEAQRETYDEAQEDDDCFFVPSEVFGGNFDDAYSGGCEDGGIEYARILLNKLGLL